MWYLKLEQINTFTNLCDSKCVEYYDLQSATQFVQISVYHHSMQLGFVEEIVQFSRWCRHLHDYKSMKYGGSFLYSPSKLSWKK